MKIYLTDKCDQSSFVGCCVVFSDRMENGKVRFQTEDRTTVATVGKLVWIDGEHEEEEKLRRSFNRVLGYCTDSGVTAILIDLSEENDTVYLTNVLLEETSSFLSDKDEEKSAWTVTVRVPTQNSPVLEEFKNDVSNQTVSCQSFGDYGDPLKERFERFNKELSPAVPIGVYLIDLIARKGIKKYPSGYPVYSLVYKASGISKYTFSKILTQKVNHPTKETVAALTIGLRLDIQEAQDFYNAAGYYLGTTDFIDKVIRFFIKEGKYDINEVNNCLYAYNRPLLGEQQYGDNELK